MSEILLVNPRRRRRSTTKRRTRARRKNPVRRKRRASSSRRRTRRRSYRRNPAALGLNVRSVQNNVMNAVPGAFGALGLDVALGYIPIPANWKAGALGYLVKAIGAIGLGIVARNVVRPATAVKMTEGALTVMLHGALRNSMAQFAPNVPLGMYDSGVGYYGSGWNPNYQIDDPDAMGAYLPDMSRDPLNTDMRDLGAYLDAGYDSSGENY